MYKKMVSNLLVVTVFPEFFLVISICLIIIFYSISFGARYEFVHEEKFLNFTIFKNIVYNQSTIYLSLLVVFLVLLLSFNLQESYIVFNYGSLVFDGLSYFGGLWVVCFSFLFFFSSLNSNKGQKVYSFEYWVLLLFGLVSLLLLLKVSDLLILYLVLELQALTFYVLASYQRYSAFSTEAGLKYFIVGAFSSGFLLFGISLIYGVSGTTSFEDLARLYAVIFSFDSVSFGFIVGLFFIIFSFLFKLMAAPMHLWGVDVYEGSAILTVLFFSNIPKISVILCLSRFLFEIVFVGFFYWQLLLLFSALGSLITGVFGAMFQKKVKRFFVYSSITHVGFMLLGITTGTLMGLSSVFIYIFAYVLISIYVWSSFLGISRFDRNGVSVKYLDEMVDYLQDNLAYVFGFSIVIFSIAGVPPLFGFFAKLQVFLVIIQESVFTVSFIFVVFSVISCFYYLRVIKIIYFSNVFGNVCKSRRYLCITISRELSIVLSILFFSVLSYYFQPSLVCIISFKIALTFFI